MASPGPDKKAKVEEGSGEDAGSPKVSPELLESMEKLHDIQNELEKINEAEIDENLAVALRFDVLRKPVLAWRNEVIGTIHEFWLIVFLSHPTLGNLLSKEDEKIVKFMVSLEVEEDVNQGLSFIFSFAPNPYFDNTKLTKTYHFDKDENLTMISCEPIQWKEGKDITNNNVPGNGANKRPYTSESFFSWFSDTMRSDGLVDEIAEIIRDDMWLNPLRHLQNEVVDELGLNQQGVEDDEEVTGGGNESMNEDEDDDEEEGFDDNDEYHEEDDSMDRDDNDNDDDDDDDDDGDE